MKVYRERFKELYRRAGIVLIESLSQENDYRIGTRLLKKQNGILTRLKLGRKKAIVKAIMQKWNKDPTYGSLVTNAIHLRTDGFHGDRIIKAIGFDIVAAIPHGSRFLIHRGRICSSMSPILRSG